MGRLPLDRIGVGARVRVIAPGARYRAIVAVSYPRWMVSRRAVAERFEAVGFTDVIVYLSDPSWPDAPAVAPPAGTWLAWAEGTYAGAVPLELEELPRAVVASWPLVDESAQGGAGAGVEGGAPPYELADFFPEVVTRATVLDTARKLDASVQAFDVEQRTAPRRAPAAWRDGWASWLERWRTFLRESEDTIVMLDAKSRLLTVESYQRELEAWRSTWSSSTGQRSALPRPDQREGATGLAVPPLALVAVALIVALYLWTRRA